MKWKMKKKPKRVFYNMLCKWCHPQAIKSTSVLSSEWQSKPHMWFTFSMLSRYFFKGVLGLLVGTTYLSLRASLVWDIELIGIIYMFIILPYWYVFSWINTWTPHFSHFNFDGGSAHCWGYELSAMNYK